MRFENGATLILETSWILHHDDSAGDTHLWLYGTQAGAHWPANKIIGTNYRTKQYRDITLPFEPGMEAHAAECVAFADAVAHGKPSPVPAEQSLDVIAILDGLYRAAASGREVTLDR